MDYSPATRRTIKKPTQDLYSTFVVHSDEEDNQNDDESLPPLLKRLPKDFGAAVDSDDDESISGTMIVKRVESTRHTTRRGRDDESDDEDNASISGTMIVKTNPRRVDYTRRRNEEEEEDDEDEEGGGFGTFVVRSDEREDESVSGTFVRRSVGGGRMSTMSRAVASMQGVGEGFGKGRGQDHGDGGHSRKRTSKMSSGSIADSITREDPSTKYELLHELGTVTFCLLIMSYFIIAI
ncbi:hypothetical protein Tco_0888973 [Tanacetum coccineum]